MPLIQLKHIQLAYGSAPLLDGVDLIIESGERVCLVGRNGSGKSSLLRILAGIDRPDAGERIVETGRRIAWLPQEVPIERTGLVEQIVHSGLRQYPPGEEWRGDVLVDQLLGEMNLPARAEFATLSGGWKRRVLLAAALAGEPDLLLLDEPTNHLDLQTILWLEDFLIQRNLTLAFVTHDRGFLRRLATRIVELDRGRLTSWDCDYDTFILRREAAWEAEEKQWAAFDKKLAREEAWLRQGVKARRTRNEGRVRALESLREQRRQRRERVGQVRMKIQESSPSGRKVIEAKGLSFAYDQVPIVQNLDLTLWRGDKLGIIGPNGCGKTTLLNLLLKRLEPSSGTVEHGTQLQTVFLDQMRGRIDPEHSVAWNVAGDAENVIFQGRPRHIHAYLRDFLFPPERIRMAARYLSGGEANRLILARLFLQPANLLVLDEPTNDLDAETLDLLAELLVQFEGTVLLVSHDRDFLNQVVNGLLIFEGAGLWEESVGGYDDWVANRKAKAMDASVKPAKSPTAPTSAPPAKSHANPKAKSANASRSASPRKMSNREKRELADIPARLEALETELAACAAQLADPALYTTRASERPALEARLKSIQQQIEVHYARWIELEALQNATAKD